jgi:UDP-glucose 6-dehydrogenase
MKVAFFDLGSGAVVSCLSAKGRDVWGVDLDELRVALISIEHSAVLEPNLRSQVTPSAASGIPHATFRPHDALHNADVSQDFTALLTSPRPRIIDLIGGMEPALEALGGHREFAW